MRLEKILGIFRSCLPNDGAHKRQQTKEHSHSAEHAPPSIGIVLDTALPHLHAAQGSNRQLVKDLLLPSPQPKAEEQHGKVRVVHVHAQDLGAEEGMDGSDSSESGGTPPPLGPPPDELETLEAQPPGSGSRAAHAPIDDQADEDKAAGGSTPDHGPSHCQPTAAHLGDLGAVPARPAALLAGNTAPSTMRRSRKHQPLKPALPAEARGRASRNRAQRAQQAQQAQQAQLTDTETRRARASDPPEPKREQSISAKRRSKASTSAKAARTLSTPTAPSPAALLPTRPRPSSGKQQPAAAVESPTEAAPPSRPHAAVTFDRIYNCIQMPSPRAAGAHLYSPRVPGTSTFSPRNAGGAPFVCSPRISGTPIFSPRVTGMPKISARGAGGHPYSPRIAGAHMYSPRVAVHPRLTVAEQGPSVSCKTPDSCAAATAMASPPAQEVASGISPLQAGCLPAAACDDEAGPSEKYERWQQQFMRWKQQR